jgi:hypothetical protein
MQGMLRPVGGLLYGWWLILDVQRSLVLLSGAGSNDELGWPPASANHHWPDAGCNHVNGSCRVILS